jgi:hypothetical protein
MMPSNSESSDEDVGQANNSMECDPIFVGTCSSNFTMDGMKNSRISSPRKMVSCFAMMFHYGSS